MLARSGGMLGGEQLQRGLDLGEERLEFGALVRTGIRFEPRQQLLLLDRSFATADISSPRCRKGRSESGPFS